ncbi:OmpA family protein [bacterium]|nr:MAG: OmpA family protein [bacterium]
MNLFTVEIFSQRNINTVLDLKFDKAPLDWELGEKFQSNTTISNGVLRMENISTSNSSGWSVQDIGIKEGDNYTIEFDARQIKGDDTYGYGILFSKTDSPSQYLKLLITSQKKRLFNGFWNGKSQSIRDWKTNENIKPFNEWNKIKIVRTKNVIDCYVNEVKIVTYGSYNDFGQKIALVVDKSGMIVEFDNFKLTKFDYDIKTVDYGGTTVKKEYVKELNSIYDDKYCFVSSDGKTMYITRDDDPNGYGKSDIWVSHNTNGIWTKPTNLGKPINNDNNNSIISTSTDMNTMYVMNLYKPDGSPAGSGISVTSRTKDGWEVPQKVEIENLTNVNRYASYFFTNNNKVLVIATQPNNEDYDEKDLFVCFKKDDGTYTSPKNLGPTINTLEAEFNPVISADSRTMYYLSLGKPGYGTADIWMSRRLDDTWEHWSEPLNMGPSINSDAFELQLILDAKGEFGYMISSDKSIPGFTGKSDIMKVNIPEAARPEPVVLVYGKVLNKSTNEPINAAITYYDLVTDKEYGTAISDINTGDYSIVLPRGINYGFKSETKNYASISENLDVTSLDKYTEIERNLYLVPIEIGQKIRLNNLFFDTGEYTLKESSNSELKNLLKLLQQNPKMKIKIVGHTDNVGNDANNLILSKNRAKAVYDWLIANKIDSNKLSAVGMGEKEPVATNDTDEGKQQNRRVEFTILEK